MKILCIEDDEELAKLLQRSLVKQHYQVELTTDGQMGWDLAETSAYDLILLDWMVPNLTGIEFCQKLRTTNYTVLNPNRNTPILLMTALDAVTNRILGLNAGADDYVVKPFDLDELLARIRALLRRSQGMRSPVLQWGELCLNPNSCEVSYQGQPILLAAKEYELLELFLRNPDQIFSLDRLLVNLWAMEEIPSQGAVRSHIKGLRQKLKQAGSEDPIETIYKLGYRLKQYKEAETAPNLVAPGPVAPNLAAPAPPILAQPYPPKFESLPLDITTQVAADLWDVWQECRPTYCDRLAIIEAAVTALQQGTLPPSQQQAATQEAHTLIGSLGSFGLTEASQLSRQIQQILKQPTPLGPSEAEHLSRLIARLQSHLAPPAADQPTVPAPATPPVAPLSLPFPSLLVITEDLPSARLLAEEAPTWGLQAHIATTLPETQQVLQTIAVDAIVLDLNCSHWTSDSLEFLATLRQQHPEIPVVTLTAEDSFAQRVAVARLGGHCFLKKPIAPHQILTAATQVLQQLNQSLARVLAVDDDPEFLHLLSTLLQPCGYQVTLLSDPQQFWPTLEQTAPDLLILDVHLDVPDGQAKSVDRTTLSGIELCQVIRNDPCWARLPVLFLSAYTDVETIQRAFAVGADDFLSKPVVAQELLTRVRTRLAQRQLWYTADLDELTGVSLRRKAQEELTRLIRLARRQQQPFSLAVLDLDHFKAVNDQYGHDTGDRVLSYVGMLLRYSFRQEDVVGRWGGEEFIIGMYGITKHDGLKRLQEVLEHLRQCVFPTQNDLSFQVTFSAGVAQLPEDGDELHRLYHFADQALYRAKLAGRNRIFATEAPPPNRNTGSNLEGQS